MPKTDPFSENLIALLPNLRRFALSLSRRPDVADDLVQITAERAFAARGRYDPATRLDAWLFRILRNAFIDMTRRDRVRGTSVDVHDEPDILSVDGVSVTETALMVGSAQDAMARLPDDQRQVMILICVEEMSYAEAAEILGIPAGTVMSRLSRARAAVAKSLGIN